MCNGREPHTIQLWVHILTIPIMQTPSAHPEEGTAFEEIGLITRPIRKYVLPTRFVAGLQIVHPVFCYLGAR